MLQSKNLKGGSWQKLTLLEQLGNIGGEVSRALLWQRKDERIFKNSLEQALELLDFTVQDPRWRTRLKEIARVRELLGGIYTKENLYSVTLSDLDNYFFEFAYGSKLRK